MLKCEVCGREFRNGSEEGEVKELVLHMRVFHKITGSANGVCPECGTTLYHQEGCALCPACGYSKC